MSDRIQTVTFVDAKGKRVKHPDFGNEWLTRTLYLDNDPEAWEIAREYGWNMKIETWERVAVSIEGYADAEDSSDRPQPLSHVERLCEDQSSEEPD